VDAIDDRQRRLLEQQKQEALGVLATGVAHAFNNILTGVLGYTELAARDLEPDSMARDFLEEVTRAARRGAELTAQLLLHAGKGRFTLKEVNLSTVVQDMARQLLAAVPSKAVLRFESPGGCPLIMGDVESMRQLLSQLVTNAGEALGGRSGKITVRTAVRDVASAANPSPNSDCGIPAGRYVSLSVIDTGSGMNEATLSRIFEPFFTTRFIGRGLGLSAVRGIVQGHRGFIQVESKPGKGSTFEILFPALPDKPAESAPAEAPPVSS
jgi:signal transduction histidine kinase